MAVRGKKDADSWSKRAIAAAKAANVPVEGPTAREAEQQELLKQDVPVVPMVQGNKFIVRFVKPATFEKVGDDRKVELEFSASLTPEHDELLESQVLNAVKYLRKNHAGSVGKIEIPNQTIYVYLAPEMDEELKLIAVEVQHVSVSYVVEKGNGKENKMLRLQFRAIADANKNVSEFARSHFGDSVWITMQAAQGRLAEEAA